MIYVSVISGVLNGMTMIVCSQWWLSFL